MLVVEITPAWCEANGLSYRTLLSFVFDGAESLRSDESDQPADL